MRITRRFGTLLLAIWLILEGLSRLFDASFSVMGVLILLER
jgi:hypothetical protein